MLSPSGEARYAAPSASQRRLGVQLADMIPGAVSVHVSLADPKRQWPHPYTVAIDEHGEQLELSRTTTKIAARWVQRTWPEADWTRPHSLDLSTGQLAVAAVRGR
ncbi:transcriptional regulator [Kitasatospora sp. NPDC059146]|uniref:transcriptional regulator n=1 Tax=Kitasatospora sp. NPDC059146 TaxID=3346741 RepID=UPI003694C685